MTHMDKFTGRIVSDGPTVFFVAFILNLPNAKSR